jgi:carboxymethylenebutenolidase
VLPVTAQTIKTASEGLSTGEAAIKVGEHTMPVYFAKPANLPEGKNNLPVILVISEIFGVHEHIADVARRFAKLGYLALAPELFGRQGDPTSMGTIAELQKNIISKVPDAQVMSDLDAVVTWASANGGDAQRMAITGFCWGGRITWMYSAHNPKIKAGVAWYGRLVGDTSALQPKHPVDIAAALTTPILGLYGAKDTGIGLDTVEKMKAALAQGKSGSEFNVYANSPHAFHADYRPSYVEADAKDGWNKCVAWLKKNGVA